MAKKFHDDEFDDATQIKLAIFRGYIRKWLPVFLTARKSGAHDRAVNLFDLFAGPGADAAGNPGSPRIIQDELKRFCQTHGDIKEDGIEVTLYFNDKDAQHIEQLQRCLDETACPKGCCRSVLTSQAFKDALTDHLTIMRQPRTANLVIMDQFGVKEVTPDVANTLAGCRTTDILFFISSSYIRRFAGEPAIQNYFHMSAEELAASDYKSIHRHICEYFRSNLRTGIEYHLAPFSIRKGGNIYGVVFGSGNLLGLQKFLEVCWELDGVTGEANYDIDDDPSRYGERFLLAEMNVIRKQDEFQRELELRLRGNTEMGNESPPATNLDIYRFTLEHGFLPQHANAYLRTIQRSGRLEVTDPKTGHAVRKGSLLSELGALLRHCGSSRVPNKGLIRMRTSKIEWTEATWNPVTGCTKISAGCRQLLR